MGGNWMTEAAGVVDVSQVGTDDARVRAAAALESLRGAGRGLGELVDVVAAFGDRLRALELVVEAHAAPAAGRRRGVDVVGALGAVDGRLRRLESEDAAHSAHLTASDRNERVLVESVEALDRRLYSLESAAPA